MNERALPTDAHLAILSVLWRLGPATVREVHEALPDEDRRGYTTTLKLMQIMAERGLVRRDESQRSHVYTAQADEAEMQSALVDDLATRAFSGSAAQLVMRALSNKPASAVELESIRRMLDELEHGRAADADSTNADGEVR